MNIGIFVPSCDVAKTCKYLLSCSRFDNEMPVLGQTPSCVFLQVLTSGTSRENRYLERGKAATLVTCFVSKLSRSILPLSFAFLNNVGSRLSSLTSNLMQSKQY